MSTLREARLPDRSGTVGADKFSASPSAWQLEFLRAPAGASIIALTARQVGKTTIAAGRWRTIMLFTPGGLCVIACPSHRQSAEAVRRVKDPC